MAQIQTQSGPFSSHSRNTERCPVAKIIIAKESVVEQTMDRCPEPVLLDSNMKLLIKRKYPI